MKEVPSLRALLERVLGSRKGSGFYRIFSIVVPFFGLTDSILRIPKSRAKKELQWRL